VEVPSCEPSDQLVAVRVAKIGQLARENLPDARLH
jgi:hypothetical protein